MSETDLRLLTVIVAAISLAVSVYVLIETRIRKGRIEVFYPNFLVIGKDTEGDFILNASGVLGWSSDRGGFLLDASAKIQDVHCTLWYEASDDDAEIEKANARFIRREGVAYDFIFYPPIPRKVTIGTGDCEVTLSFFTSMSPKAVQKILKVNVSQDIADQINRKDGVRFYWSQAEQKYLVDREDLAKSDETRSGSPKGSKKAPRVAAKKTH